jgi:hypothetical protein
MGKQEREWRDVADSDDDHLGDDIDVDAALFEDSSEAK